METPFRKETEITIINVIDPGSFWVSWKGALNINQIDEWLRKDGIHDKAQQDDYKPVRKDLVRVAGRDGLYYRGEVLESDDDKVKVFLLDCGKYEIVPLNCVEQLSSLWSQLEGQAISVGLYGIVPKDLSWEDLEDTELLGRKLLVWEDGRKEVNSLLSEATSLVFRTKSRIDGILYGSVTLSVNGTDVDLASTLVDQDVGIFSEDFVSDLIILNHSRLQFICQGKFPTCLQFPTFEVNEKEKVTSQNSTEGVVCSPEHIQYIVSFCRGEIRPCYDPKSNKCNVERNSLNKKKFIEMTSSDSESSTKGGAKTKNKKNYSLKKGKDSKQDVTVKIGGNRSGNKKMASSFGSSKGKSGSPSQSKKPVGRGDFSRVSAQAYPSNTKDEAVFRVGIGGSTPDSSLEKNSRGRGNIVECSTTTRNDDVKGKGARRKGKTKGSGGKKDTCLTYGSKSFDNEQFSDADGRIDSSEPQKKISSRESSYTPQLREAEKCQPSFGRGKKLSFLCDELSPGMIQTSKQDNAALSPKQDIKEDKAISENDAFLKSTNKIQGSSGRGQYIPTLLEKEKEEVGSVGRGQMINPSSDKEEEMKGLGRGQLMLALQEENNDMKSFGRGHKIRGMLEEENNTQPQIGFKSKINRKEEVVVNDGELTTSGQQPISTFQTKKENKKGIWKNKKMKEESGKKNRIEGGHNISPQTKQNLSRGPESQTDMEETEINCFGRGKKSPLGGCGFGRGQKLCSPESLPCLADHGSGRGLLSPSSEESSHGRDLKSPSDESNLGSRLKSPSSDEEHKFGRDKKSPSAEEFGLGRGLRLSSSEGNRVGRDSKSPLLGKGDISRGLKSSSSEENGFGRGLKSPSSDEENRLGKDKTTSSIEDGLPRGLKSPLSEGNTFGRGLKSPLSEDRGLGRGVKSPSSEENSCGRGLKSSLLGESCFGRGQKSSPCEDHRFGRDKTSPSLDHGLGRGQKSPLSDGNSLGRGLKSPLSEERGLGRGQNLIPLLKELEKEHQRLERDPSKEEHNIPSSGQENVLGRSQASCENLSRQLESDQNAFSMELRTEEKKGMGRGQTFLSKLDEKLENKLEPQKIPLFKSPNESDKDESKEKGFGRGQKLFSSPGTEEGRGHGLGRGSSLPGVAVVEGSGAGRGRKLLTFLADHETKVGEVPALVEIPKKSESQPVRVPPDNDCTNNPQKCEEDTYEEPKVEYLTPESMGGGLLLSQDSESEESSREEDKTREVASQIQEPTSSSDNETQHSFDSSSILTCIPVTSDCTVGKLLERMKMSGGLLHGDINVVPMSSIYDVQLHALVLDSLEKKQLRDLTRSQMYVVPVLMQRRSLALVGPPSSGKSLSYIVPLLSLLLTNAHYSDLRDGQGPRCVFVVSSASSVRYIARLCAAISAARLTIITTYGGGLELERKDDLTNGCDVLITTPRCWLRLLKHRWVTNVNRLCHLVLDEADTLFKLFLPEVKEILAIVNKMKKTRKCGPGVQIVVVGENWSPEMESMIFNDVLGDKPVLCVTAHVEAALYARIKPQVLFLTPEKKVEKLFELVASYAGRRSIIVCNDADGVKQLRICLSMKYPNVLFAHEEMPTSLLTDVVGNWTVSKGKANWPLLVCTDDVLGDLGITDASALLHYSLPQSKTVFSTRFSCIKDSFPDRILNPKAGVPDIKVHIFLDETNEDQFPEVVNFMSRLSTAIPKKISDTVTKIKKQKELKKNEMPLCINLLQFGHCWKIGRCKDQHIFNYLRDKPRGLPQSGYVKIKILHVINATHYIVRLLAHTKSDLAAHAWTTITTNYVRIGLKMSLFFGKRENRVPFGRVRIGDIVGIEVDTDTQFSRAKVMDITARDEKCNPTKVKIVYIDEGADPEERNVMDLLKLPPDLEEAEGEAVNMYLARLMPVDLDPAWSYASTNAIRRAVAKNDVANNFFVAKIALSIGRNLVVDPLQCYELLEHTKCNIVHLSLRDFILKSKLAVHNADHIEILKKLAKDVGIETPDYTNESSAESADDREDEESTEVVQWAHLNRDDDYTPVNVISTYSPSLLFVKIANFHDKLEELQKDLEKVLEAQKKRLRPHLLKPGKLCLAKSPDSPQWNRAMITEFVGEEQVEVFYVDYGDKGVIKPSELMRIPKGFISRLPFQAIEAELVGIKPMDNEDWLPEASDLIDDFAMESDDYWKVFHAKVCEVKDNAQITKGRHYGIVLVDTTGDWDIVLNKEMVYRGFANWDNTSPEYFSEVPEGVPFQTNKKQLEVESGENLEDDEDKDLLTEEDKAILMNVSTNTTATESLTGELDSSGGFPGYARTIEEALMIISRDEAELCYDEDAVENLYPGSVEFLKQTLAIAMEQRGETSSFSSGRESDVKRNQKSLEGSNDGRIIGIPAGAESDEEYEADVSDMEQTSVVAPQPTGYLTPIILWHQNNTHVFIKVDLPSIEKYTLKWTWSYICFGSTVNEKVYQFHIDLFGPVVPATLQHAPKGMTLDIKVQKVMKGHDWPRLMYDKVKAPWIKLNPDHVKREEELTLVDEFYNKGLKCVDEGREMPPKLDGSVPACVSDQDSDGSSDVQEFSDVPFDPYDPLS